MRAISELATSLKMFAFYVSLVTLVDMKEAISFTLNKDLFQIGNEILSNAFVLRYLQYQTQYYVYANDYTITIIDDKVNQFTLNSKQHVLLEKNDYKIITKEENDENDENRKK
jgi:hypothetical protein